MTDADFDSVIDITTKPEVIVYKKTFDDGTTVVYEAILGKKKKELEFSTMFKLKNQDEKMRKTPARTSETLLDFKKKPTITGGRMPSETESNTLTSETLPAPDKSASSDANIQNKTLSEEAQKEIAQKQEQIKAYEQELTDPNLPDVLKEQTEQKIATLEQEIESLQNPINEKKQEDTVQETEQEVLPTEDKGNQIDYNTIKPIGKGVFGNIYDQFKGKAKQAVEFLLKKKEGEAIGVFHREGLGDIDLPYGSHTDKYGLEHIVDKHIKEQNDFNSVDEAVSVIDDVITNGKEVQKKWDKAVIEKDGYRVVVSKNVRDKKGNILDNKNWVVTAFDTTRSAKEKASSRKTLTTPLSNQQADGVTLPTNDAFKENTSATTRVTPDSNKGSRAVAPEDVSTANIQNKKDNKPTRLQRVAKKKFYALVNYLQKALGNRVIFEETEVQKYLDETGQEIDNSKLQIIGEKGAKALDQAEERTHRIDNLATARKMETANKDAKAIRLATGWERGADGKWRYEVDDAMATIIGERQYTKQEIKEHEEKSYDLYDLYNEEKRKLKERGRYPADINIPYYKEAIKEDEITSIMKASNRDGGKFGKENAIYKLGEILYHNELFLTYPWFRKMKVVITDELPKENGAFITKDKYDLNNNYSGEENSIHIGLHSDNIKSILFHEIQHAIQDIEGFARGGNPAIAKRLIKEQNAYSNALSIHKQAEQKVKNKEVLVFDYGIDKAIQEIESLLGFSYPKEVRELAKLDKKELESKINQLPNSKTVLEGAEAVYKSLQGEVEARNVEKRLYYTDEQRRNTLLSETEDVAREDQIFLRGENVGRSDVRFSLNEKANSEFSKAVDEVAKGKAKRRFVNMGTTPNVLRMLDFPNTNVFISTDVMKKATQDKHNLTYKDLKQIPTQINNPISVFKSLKTSSNPDGYVVLTELTENVKGVNKPVIVALNVKTTKKGVEVIDVASAYGRNNINPILAETPLFWNTKKGQKFVNSFGLQLPSYAYSQTALSKKGVKTEIDLTSFKGKDTKDFDKPNTRYLKDKKGEVYGAVFPDGTIYLDENKANFNTPIHEFAHVWIDTLKDANKELYDTGIRLIKKSKYYKDLKKDKNYKHLTDAQIAEEALATAIGDRGEHFWSTQKKTYTPFMNWLNKFRSWLTDKFFINQKEGIKDLTLDQFLDASLHDLLGGKEIKYNKTNFKIGDNSYKVINKNGTLTVENSRGAKVSKPTERKVLREYAEQYDFTLGERFTITDDITPSDDIDSEIAQNSNNPAELAEVILRTQTKDFINDNSDADAIDIIEYVQGNVKRGVRNSKGADGSFVNQSDANNITNAIAKTYLKKDGKGLDVLAQELSEKMGREITEQDIVDIILAYPNGVNDVQKEVRDKYSNPAKQRFTELTGLPSSDWYLNKAVRQDIAKENLNKEVEKDYLNHFAEEDLLSLEQEQNEFKDYEKANEQRDEVVFRTSDTSQNEQRPRVQEKSDSVSGTKESGERIKGQADKVLKGGFILNRLPPKAERGRIKGGRRNVEATLVVGTSDGTAKNLEAKQTELEKQDYKTTADNIIRGSSRIFSPYFREGQNPTESSRRTIEATLVLETNRRTNESSLGSSRETKSEQEKLLKQYAENEGILFSETDIINRQGNKQPSGKEADVYFSKDGKTVTKIVNYSVYSETPLDFLNNRISLFNSFFPDTAYTLKGFVETDNGLSFVLEQRQISGQLLKRIATLNVDLQGQQKRVNDFMLEQFGMQPDGLDAVGNDFYRIMDLHLKNVIEGTDGNLYVIDAIPELKNKELDGEFRVEQKSTLKKGSENLQALDDALKQWENKLDQFGKETLGMNMPVAVAQGMIKAMRLAVKTAKTTLDVLEAGRNYIRNTDWYKNLSETEKNNVEKTLTDDRNVFNNMDKIIDDAVEVAREEDAKTIKSLESLQKKTAGILKRVQTRGANIDFFKICIELSVNLGSEKLA